MSFVLRMWLVATTVLLVAEDFQYALKIKPIVLEQVGKEPVNDCEDGSKEEDGESKGGKEEDKKEEKKEKDDDKNVDPEALLNAYTIFSKNKFRDALILLPDTARELESPPPEV